MSAEQKSRWQLKLFPGVYVVAGILVLLAVRTVWGYFGESRNVNRLAEELASMHVIQKTPAINRAGDSIGLIHTTEHGVGVFIRDLQAGSEQQFCDVLDVDYKASGAWTFGWSPGDETFAYSWDRTIHFVEKDGREGSGNVDGITNHFESFTWLTRDRCAYIDDLPRLAFLERSNGRWKTARFVEVGTARGYPRDIQAIGSGSVAWHNDSEIWQTDLVSGENKRVYFNPRRRFDDISYSSATETFLLVTSTNKGRSCFLLTVSDGYPDPEPVVKQLVQRPSIVEARWVNDGHGYVYVSARGDEVSLIGRLRMEEPERLIFRASRLSLMESGESGAVVYAVGAKESEPVGVWRFDLASGEQTCVLSPSGESQFPYRPVVAQRALYGGGHSAHYDFVPPADYSPERKYPLVLALGGFEWSPIAHAVYAQCLANSDVCVAFVNYRWNQSQPETVDAHTNHVMAVYQQLIASSHINIDTNRVYLIGFSAGTRVLSKLVEQYPGQWRGIMLCNPSALPEPKPGMTRTVFAIGESERWSEERFRRYQEQLAKVGIPLEWRIQQDTQHVPRSKAAMHERTVLMGKMIFEE